MQAELQRATGSTMGGPGKVTKKATAFDLYKFGLVITMGGMVQSWNDGLRGGFWEFFSSTIMMGVAYLCLALCMSEMTSALPFSGGLYGFVRVTVSPFWGFIVATCEVIQNIFYVASTVIPLGEMVTEGTKLPKSYEPIYWLIFFVISLSINIKGGLTFWRFVGLMATSSVLFLLIYIFGSMPQVDFNEHAMDPGHKTSGTQYFTGVTLLRNLPLSCWFFVGVEILPLAGAQTAVSRHDIPKAMICCVVTLFILAISVTFTAVSQSPGITGVDHMILPLNPGFSKIFKIREYRASWLSIPHVFGSAFGFMFSFGRQLSSMAKSGMLPGMFKKKTEENESPYVALIAGSLVAIIIMLPVYYKYKSFLEDLFFWCTLGSFFIYFCAFISFIELRRKYTVIDRGFVNPFGIPSAIVGAGLFALNFISITAFQGANRGLQHRIHPIAGFLVFISIGVIWYFVYVQKNQCFSDEEQKVMFSAYVIKANVRGRRKLKAAVGQREQNKSVSVSSQHSTVRTIQLISVSLRSFVSNGTTSQQSPTLQSAGVGGNSSSAGSVSGDGEAEGTNSVVSGGVGEVAGGSNGRSSPVVTSGRIFNSTTASAAMPMLIEEDDTGDYSRADVEAVMHEGKDPYDDCADDEKEGEREHYRDDCDDDLLVNPAVRQKKVVMKMRPIEHEEEDDEGTSGEDERYVSGANHYYPISTSHLQNNSGGSNGGSGSTVMLHVHAANPAATSPNGRFRLTDMFFSSSANGNGSGGNSNSHMPTKDVEQGQDEALVVDAMLSMTAMETVTTDSAAVVSLGDSGHDSGRHNLDLERDISESEMVSINED